MNEEYGVDFIARCMAGEALEKAGDGYSLVAGENIEITTDEEEKTKTISAEVPELPEVREVPYVNSSDNGRILKAVYYDDGETGVNKLEQKEISIPYGGVGDETITYTFVEAANIPGGYGKNGREYNQFMIASAPSGDYRTIGYGSYSTSQFYGHVPAQGNYLLVIEGVNGEGKNIVWSDFPEGYFNNQFSIVSSEDAILNAGAAFGNVSNQQWLQSTASFQVNGPTDIGVTIKAYTEGDVLAIRAYVIPRNTAFVEFTNTEFVEGGHPAFSGETAWEPYGTGSGTYMWAEPETFSQQQSNWTESDDTKVSYIQNKPTLAAVATSGDYNDLINTPPALPEIGPNDGGKLLQAVVTGSGIPSPNLLVQEEKEIPSEYNDGTIEYSYILQAAIPGGSDEMGTAEYNQFVYAYAGYNAQDRALDARTQSYANAQFFATLPAGSYKLVFEMVNGSEDAIYWYKSILEEDPYMALVDDSNTVIVSDNTFNQITGRTQWNQKIYTFTVNDETNVGLFYKLYPQNYRAYIVPDDTEFVAFTNSQYIETGHPTFSGTTGWAPYGKTGYDWASVQAQVQADWAQVVTTAVDYIKNKPTLGTAAAANSADFATATQGAKADTALQPGDLSGYATQTWVGQQGYLTSADEVPPVGSSDDGKVLTASYSGGQGSYSWETPSGGLQVETDGTNYWITVNGVRLYFGTTAPTGNIPAGSYGLGF